MSLKVFDFGINEKSLNLAIYHAITSQDIGGNVL